MGAAQAACIWMFLGIARASLFPQLQFHSLEPVGDLRWRVRLFSNWPKLRIP